MFQQTFTNAVHVNWDNGVHVNYGIDLYII